MASRSENKVSTGTAHEKHHTSSDNFLLYHNEAVKQPPLTVTAKNTLPPNNQVLNTSTTEPKTKIMKKEYGRQYKAEDPSLTGGINTVNGTISKSNLRGLERWLSG